MIPPPGGFLGVSSTKKAIIAILKEQNIVEDNSVGQLTLHINNGGITKICKNNWEIK
jgi:hypothetical protein